MSTGLLAGGLSTGRPRSAQFAKLNAGKESPRHQAPSVQPHFGGSELALTPLARMFSFFETSYQPGFQALSKVTANVIPRVAITRSNSERKEVLFNEVTQGATLFVSLPILSGLANPIAAKLSGISKHLIKMENESALAEAGRIGGDILQNKLKIAKLGKSFGASAFIAALLISTTYLRNYRTIKRTGFSDYKKVVGIGGPPPTPTAEDKLKAEAAMKKNVNIIKGLLMGGVAAFVSIMALAGVMARKGKGLNTQFLDKLMRHWSFVGRSSNQINGPFRSQWQTLAVWGIPSYLGWLLGCRDKYEVVEQLSKFATFLAGYFFTPRIVQKFMARKHKPLLDEAARHGAMTYTNIINNISKADIGLAQKLMKFKNHQWGILTVSNFALAGVLPLVFNQIFSKWRYQREHNSAKPTIQQQPTQPSNSQTNSTINSALPNYSPQTMQSSIIRKPDFQQWITAQSARLQPSLANAT